MKQMNRDAWTSDVVDAVPGRVLAPPATRYGAPARFGADNVLRALSAATTGEVISLNLELDDPNVPFGRGRFQRTMRQHNLRRPVGDGREIVLNDDEINVALQGSSQWDSFAHFGALDDKDGVYHGGAGFEETETDTAENLGIQALGPGIVARGVLLDLVAEAGDGSPWLPDGARVERDVIERCIARQAVDIQPGDAVLFYTGFERRRASLNGDYPQTSAGLAASTVDLWRDLDIVALIGDNPAVEATPPDYSIHIGVLRDLGIPLGEFWALDALALACRSDDRYDFVLASVPLNIHGAFGSTANAVAIR